MPAPYGVTSSGFNPKTLTEAKAELEADFRAVFGVSIDVSPRTPYGQIIGILSERFQEVWDAAQDVASSFDPDQASGPALVSIAAITGTTPLAPTRSTLVGVATGTPGTVLPVGRVVSVSGTGSRFRSTAEVTISGGGTVSVPMESEEFGPVIAVSGSLTVIETPVGGWASFSNALDADLGTNAETDAELRARRIDELAVRTAGTTQAIRSSILALADVVSATIFENTTDATNVDGMPPHSIEALVLGGVDLEIGQTILETRPAGIATHGTTTTSPTDAEGLVHVTKFTRPTAKPVYFNVVIHTSDEFPSDGMDLIKLAMVERGDVYEAGQDVKRSQFFGAIFTVPGVVDVPFLGMAYTAIAASTTENTHLTVGARDLATFDTSRIVITDYDAEEDSGTVIP